MTRKKRGDGFIASDRTHLEQSGRNHVTDGRSTLDTNEGTGILHPRCGDLMVAPKCGRFDAVGQHHGLAAIETKIALFALMRQ